jgi:hypothetical protein
MTARRSVTAAAAAAAENGTVGSGGFDYDLVIIGAGVGGHGAALHAVEKVSFASEMVPALFRSVYACCERSCRCQRDLIDCRSRDVGNKARRLLGLAECGQRTANS